MRLVLLIASSAMLWSCSEPRCRPNEVKVETICQRIAAQDAGSENYPAGDVDEDVEGRVPRQRDAGPTSAEADGSTNDGGVNPEPGLGDAGAENSPAADAGAAPAPDARLPPERDAGEPPSNVDPCTSSPAVCGAHGSCVAADAGYSCTCAPGYSGKTCALDACQSTPCDNGLACKHSATGVACVAACAPNCAAGANCSVDEDCGADGACDPAAKVCTRSCSTLTIKNRADVEAAKYCGQLSGDLILDTDFAEVTSTDFPHLRAIAGAIKGASSSALTKLTLSALESLDYGISMFEWPQLDHLSLPALGKAGSIIGNSVSVEIRLPKLTDVTGDLSFQMAGLLTLLDLAALQRVSGQMNVTWLPYLASFNCSSLSKVGGQLQLLGLLRVPYSRVSKLNTPAVAGALKVSDIGCCVPNPLVDSYMCGGGFSCGP